MITAEQIMARIDSALRTRGIDLVAMRQDPTAFKAGCDAAYHAIRIPFRWLIGRHVADATMQVVLVRADPESISRLAYNALPRPWRWIVGQKRISRLAILIAQKTERAQQRSGNVQTDPEDRNSRQPTDIENRNEKPLNVAHTERLE